jgi:transcriptional regulator with XRE-family HTH domain
MLTTLHDPRYLEIVGRLRKARRVAGLSQEVVAARLDRPQSFVSKFETAERRLDLLETLAVCRALGVTLKQVVPSELAAVLGCESADGTR